MFKFLSKELFLTNLTVLIPVPWFPPCPFLHFKLNKSDKSHLCNQGNHFISKIVILAVDLIPSCHRRILFCQEILR